MMQSNLCNGTGDGQYSKALSEIGKIRKSVVVALLTNSKEPIRYHIDHRMIDILADHLDVALSQSSNSDGKIPQLSLILNTEGGNIPAAIGMVSLIREYVTSFEVIVPDEAFSAGTVLALGADRIVMTRRACLGPADPQITGRYGSVAAADIEVFVSSPAFKENQKIEALDKLLKDQGLIAIGRLLRSQRLVRQTLTKYLSRTISDQTQRDRTLSFLLGAESLHDMGILRVQAKRDLGLPVEFADEALEQSCMQLMAAMKCFFSVPSLHGYNEQNPIYENIPVSCFSVISTGYGRSTLDGILFVQKTPKGLMYQGKSNSLVLKHLSFGE